MWTEQGSNNEPRNEHDPDPSLATNTVHPFPNYNLNDHSAVATGYSPHYTFSSVPTCTWSFVAFAIN